MKSNFLKLFLILRKKCSVPQEYIVRGVLYLKSTIPRLRLAWAVAPPHNLGGSMENKIA